MYLDHARFSTLGLEPELRCTLPAADALVHTSHNKPVVSVRPPAQPAETLLLLKNAAVRKQARLEDVQLSEAPLWQPNPKVVQVAVLLCDVLCLLDLLSDMLACLHH